MAEDHFPAILGLIGTLSGTAIGFAGGLVTQLLLERRRQAAEKKKMRSDKLEELVSLLWKQLRFVGKNPEDPEGVINQNAKIASIMTIYFPEFHDHSYNLLELALNYQKIKLDGIDDDIEESMKTYATEHGKFLYDIEQYVKREFQ